MFLADAPKEVPDIGVKNPVHFPVVDPHHQGVQRIMRPPSRSEPVRKPEEVLLVDGIQHHDGGALEDFIFQGGNRERPLPPIRLRYVRPAGWLRPVGSAMDPSVQILELTLEASMSRRPLRGAALRLSA